MRISFTGQAVEEPEIRAALIGCGSHAFRNILPTFAFAPVRLVATCDLDLAKARLFAERFGAQNAYADYREMIVREALDAVLVITGYDERGRPLYPTIAIDCLQAGCHVWIEKPPAASCAEVEHMQRAAARSGKNVMVGFKKIFYPVNEKARELAAGPDFCLSLALFQYPQYVPTVEELQRYASGQPERVAMGFLDHLCHPVSLMISLLGMPSTLYYQRSAGGAGAATFGFSSGALASLALTHGASLNGGMERTTLIGRSGRHIVVDNNLRLSDHRTPPPAPGTGYGSSPDFYTGAPGETTAVWEPEFSLGQLYNKGLFLLGYWGEINEFAHSILQRRPPAQGTLEQAWQVTRVFEAFLEGPGRAISL
jgi:predicted dehydrogenase